MEQAKKLVGAIYNSLLFGEPNHQKPVSALSFLGDFIANWISHSLSSRLSASELGVLQGPAFRANLEDGFSDASSDLGVDARHSDILEKVQEIGRALAMHLWKSNRLAANSFQDTDLLSISSDYLRVDSEFVSAAVRCLPIEKAPNSKQYRFFHKFFVDYFLVQLWL